MVKDYAVLEKILNLSRRVIIIFVAVELSNNKISFRTSLIYSILFMVPIAIGALDLVSFNIKIIYLFYAFIGIYILKFLKIKNFKNINILPLTLRSLLILGLGFGVFAGVTVYIFGIDPKSIDLMYHFTYLFFELVLTLYFKEQENIYDKIYKLYYLSDHIGQEREEFARVIHDDIVQDIFASKNYLSTKDPDLGFVKEILTDLEDKARGIMKYYQSNVYDDLDVGASLEDVFHNIASLYKGKDLDLKMDIDPEAANLKDKKLKRLLLLVSKELVNNIYKHSEGRYLNYSLSMEDNKVLINLESDGATKEDFKNIQESKRGILILTLLVEFNSGKINYDLKGDKLFTQVLMEVWEN
ncbi:histidine kinase [Citroniella saccharovorans]|uniref:Histidine kinase n=2 Tax=Citroniella saccharovorans TaxID=2053367 RepID=A0AAW9MYY9_9FIRM|nr:histidine kinase [Citroniella saccharovorans]MEB3429267.1 histidine kinase [Citroniella saccharovorans]